MADRHVESILTLIDGGLQHPASGGSGYTIKADRCVRDGCDRQPDGGRAFCPPCLAWVNCETDDDPLPPKPTPAPTPSVAADSDGYDWVEYFGGSCFEYGID